METMFERIFKRGGGGGGGFDCAEEKAMLINVVSEKMPEKYIVAASGRGRLWRQ